MNRPGLATSETTPLTNEAGTETILIVEDEASLRTINKRILESCGYSTLVAGTGDEAIRMLEGHEGSVELMLTDMVMPGMSGRGLALRVAEIRPEMAVLYTSGYSEGESLSMGILGKGKTFLAKPYSIAELKQRVREVLDSRARGLGADG